jgi:hypothetical protein
MTLPNSKPCEVCDITIHRDPKQRIQSWAHQKFCGDKCREHREREQRKSYRAEAREYLADNSIAPRQWRQDSDWIPVGLLTPREEAPERIRKGVFQRMTRGAVI